MGPQALLLIIQAPTFALRILYLTCLEVTGCVDTPTLNALNLKPCLNPINPLSPKP